MSNLPTKQEKHILRWNKKFPIVIICQLNPGLNSIIQWYSKFPISTISLKRIETVLETSWWFRY
jgi:hypothetical protein